MMQTFGKDYDQWRRGRREQEWCLCPCRRGQGYGKGWGQQGWGKGWGQGNWQGQSWQPWQYQMGQTTTPYAVYPQGTVQQWQ